MTEASRTSREREERLRDFGYRVRQLRDEAGLSQAALADQANVHVTYLSGIERGLRNPSYLTLLDLAAALGVSPSDMIASGAETVEKQ